MSNQYVFQSGAIGDELILVCQTTGGQPVFLPSGATYTVELQDPNGVVSSQPASFVAPNQIVLTTTAGFNFTTPGVWHAQGFVTQGVSSVAKTALASFTVNQALA